jgi:hypothetical protein
MENHEKVVRMAGTNPGLLRKFGRALPFIGDASNFVGYLLDSQEPSLEQRIRNAVIIGGGGALASVLTGGLDAIPAYVQLAGNLGQTYNVRKTPINPVFEVAPVFDPNNYLREYAYSMDPNKQIPESENELRRFKQVFADLEKLKGMTKDFRYIHGGN